MSWINGPGFGLDADGHVVISGYHVEQHGDNAYEATFLGTLSDVELGYGRRYTIEASGLAELLVLVAAQRIIGDMIERAANPAT